MLAQDFHLNHGLAFGKDVQDLAIGDRCVLDPINPVLFCSSIQKCYEYESRLTFCSTVSVLDASTVAATLARFVRRTKSSASLKVEALLNTQ